MKEKDEKEVSKFVDGITNFIKDIFHSNQRLDPMLWILVDVGTDYTVMSWPVPEMGIASDEAKDILAVGMVKLLAHLNNVDVRPVCTLFTTEAWVRQLDKDDLKNGKVPENWKDLPKTEALMLSFETDTKGCTICFDITETSGKRTLSLSDLTKDASLKDIPKELTDTRFSCLIQRALEYEI